MPIVSLNSVNLLVFVMWKQLRSLWGGNRIAKRYLDSGFCFVKVATDGTNASLPFQINQTPCYGAHQITTQIRKASIDQKI
jgi:hypothetical protein